MRQSLQLLTNWQSPGSRTIRSVYILLLNILLIRILSSGHEQLHQQYPKDDETSIGRRHAEKNLANLKAHDLRSPEDILLDAAYRAVKEFESETPDLKAEAFREKASELLSYRGSDDTVVHNYVQKALAEAQKGNKSEVLGISGEISGIYEVKIRRGTELNSIKFGDIEGMNVIVHMKDRLKEFDAVSSNTVFEFKFHLSLYKLYQQVIGGVTESKMPHLMVLLDERFKDIRNLVYFGENDDGGVAPAIRRYLENNPDKRRGLKVTEKGFSFESRWMKCMPFYFQMKCSMEFLGMRIGPAIGTESVGLPRT